MAVVGIHSTFRLASNVFFHLISAARMKTARPVTRKSMKVVPVKVLFVNRSSSVRCTEQVHPFPPRRSFSGDQGVLLSDGGDPTVVVFSPSVHPELPRRAFSGPPRGRIRPPGIVSQRKPTHKVIAAVAARDGDAFWRPETLAPMATQGRPIYLPASVAPSICSKNQQ